MGPWTPAETMGRLIALMYFIMGLDIAATILNNRIKMKIIFRRAKTKPTVTVRKEIVSKINFAGVQFIALKERGLQIPVLLGKL